MRLDVFHSMWLRITWGVLFIVTNPIQKLFTWLWTITVKDVVCEGLWFPIIARIYICIFEYICIFKYSKVFIHLAHLRSIFTTYSYKAMIKDTNQILIFLNTRNPDSYTEQIIDRRYIFFKFHTIYFY